MDPERVPPLPQQSEITSPVHALDTDTTTGTIQPNPPIPSHSYAPRRTARIDSSNLSPFAGNGSTTESPSSEKLEVSEILSLQQNINAYIFLRSLYNHLHLFDFPNQTLEKGKLE